ncbi:hypothetical protein LOK49_LG07G00229 [Camellia lanceoleosa]|uniref:Uncharacterized protein n=1 Tax=Camellia lanceoleosa TaxID=1840588 RepID=A0ACC0H6K4_9ERIC|nr:hypothetical protein LOK49_LG07G00229 [Camellia lanceoleosa]
MDLRKPLISHLSIGKRTYGIEYEHIHSLCFSCGRIGHRKEVCIDNIRTTLEPTSQGVVGEESQRQPTIFNNGPGPSNTKQTLEPYPGTYGPWMTVSKPPRKPRGSTSHKGPNTQQTNRFEILKEGADLPQGQKAHLDRDKNQRSKAQTDMGFKYKERAMNHKGGESESFTLAVNETREEIILGKQATTDMKIRDQTAGLEKVEATTLLSIPSFIVTPSSPTTVQPSTTQIHHTTNHSPHHKQNLSNLRTKHRDPPDKNGGGQGEFPNDVTRTTSEQSSGGSNLRERSVSPHRLRMVERRNQSKDTTMETNGSRPGSALYFDNSPEINRRQPQDSKGISGPC